MVSLFASAVRPQLFPALFKSLEGTSVPYEVIFSGTSYSEYPGISYEQPLDYTPNWFKYYKTKNIKPAQNYEIARRHCTGDVVVWIADDMEFPNNVIGKAYDYWKSQNNEKLILSIQTKETGYEMPKGELFPMDEHCFYGRMKKTPLMAPVAMMSRKFLEEIGGFDRRFICGQYENFCVMMAYERGATVEIFGGPDCYIDIDHLGKSLAIGESKTEADFIHRPFAKGYINDRNVLETSWTTFDPVAAFKAIHAGERPHTLREVSKVQLDKFEPYEDTDILVKSQSNNLTDRWV